jgi:hypothetical protein
MFAVRLNSSRCWFFDVSNDCKEHLYWNFANRKLPDSMERGTGEMQDLMF